jgi:adenosylcobinamide-GDP ribazoletransferase
MQSFLVALAFLTIIPIRFREMPDEAAVARSRFWHPVVGLLLGALLGGWTLAVAHFAPPMIGAFLVLTAWVLITGALHLDGFCDLCDGLFGGTNPEERLRIMKEPTRGTFAMVGCVLLLLGKWVALEQLLTSQASYPAEAAILLAVAVSQARSMVFLMAGGAKYPRAAGTGKVVIEASRIGETVASLFCVAAINFVGAWGLLAVRGLHIPFVPNVLSMGAIFFVIWTGPAILAVYLLRSISHCQLGGITGDCLGAGIEMAELIFLVVAAIFQVA